MAQAAEKGGLGKEEAEKETAGSSRRKAGRVNRAGRLKAGPKTTRDNAEITQIGARVASHRTRARPAKDRNVPEAGDLLGPGPDLGVGRDVTGRAGDVSRTEGAPGGVTRTADGRELTQGSLRGRIWAESRRDNSVRDALIATGMSPVLAELTSAREGGRLDPQGYLSPAIKNAMPNPRVAFKDMETAANRLADAIEAREPVAIWSDYDVDGATAGATLSRFLSMMGSRNRVYIPDRIEEGYGPNVTGMQELQADGYSLVCILDSGTTAFEVIDDVNALGMTVIIVDHHMSEDRLPAALAVVNPNRKDETGEYGYLCAAGLTFLVCVATAAILTERGFFRSSARPDLMRLLDLTALGTVADVVPLVGLNRAYVRTGLAVMGRRENIGLTALMERADVKGMPDAYHCGFQLGPRINAGGRIGVASTGCRLLSETDVQEAGRMADLLDSLNRERQQIEQHCLELAIEQVETEQKDRACLTVIGDDWHEGVIGIVAGRLKELYDRPALVFSRLGDHAKASGRSVLGFDMGSAVISARKAGMLIKGGGHAMACGLTVGFDRYHEFCEYIEAEVAASEAGTLGRLVEYDMILPPQDVTIDLIRSIEKMAPFGTANPKPSFIIPRLRLDRVTVMKGVHYKLHLAGHGRQLVAIAFKIGGSDFAQNLEAARGRYLDVFCRLSINEFRGEVSPQLMLEDARISEF